MKKTIFITIFFSLFCHITGQNNLYLVYEFMRVDIEQEGTYMDIETFWQKIHEERVKNGDIIGWDLWRLQPGGEDQGYQYLTVNLYDDKVKMMSGAGDFWKAVTQAYPNLSEEKLNEKFNQTSKSRDLAVRLYVEQVDKTEDEFEVSVGTVAIFHMMQAVEGKYWEYEEGERKAWKTWHQQQVDNNTKGSWKFNRIMMPSDNHASHITVNMFKNWDQRYMESPAGPKLSASTRRALNKGVLAREVKNVYQAVLIRQVR